MSDELATPRGSRLGRSPAYPGIGLEQAVERVKQVRGAQGSHFAHVDAVCDVWDLSPRASKARVTLAALRYFGLMDFEGRGQDRRAKVSQLGLDILFTEEDSAARAQSLQKAALNPSIHRAIWEEYQGELPDSDTSLKFALIRDRGFNDNTVGQFIGLFRQTLGYAGLTGTHSDLGESPSDAAPSEVDRDSSDANARHEEGEDIRPRAVMSVSADLRQISIPVSTGEWPILHVPHPMTQQAWNEMVTVLEAMKPGLVVDSSTTLGSKGDQTKSFDDLDQDQF